MGLNNASRVACKNRMKVLVLSAVCAISLTGCETIGEISAAYLDQVQQTQNIQSKARANCNGVNEHGYNYWDTATNSCKFVATSTNIRSNDCDNSPSAVAERRAKGLPCTRPI